MEGQLEEGMADNPIAFSDLPNEEKQKYIETKINEY